MMRGGIGAELMLAFSLKAGKIKDDANLQKKAVLVILM